ncbi:hypothetical protein [Bacillus alkalicellulosilyticus]|uniref:hypothetical protein n=1 Tax=Alkalihalobacterium alkalicellulosilyticum TaxID=1912214 RepID=UPI0009982E43|nr:hypothetical protein [Bacillus alkalicellulosilyticus]
MVKEWKSISMYLFYDNLLSILTFWGFFILSIPIFITIAYMFPGTTIVISAGMIIFIFCSIAGFLMTKETFPSLIKLGTTRTSYVIVTSLFMAGIALTMTIIALIATLAVASFAPENVSLVSMTNLTNLESTWYNDFIFNLVICFFLLVSSFFLGTVFYRLGLIGGLAVILALFITFMIPEIREFMFDSVVTANLIAFIVIAIVLIFPSWLLLRTATAVPAATR